MRLVRGAWKLLVGVKDALVLLFMLIFFGALYAVLSANPNPAVGTGALVLDLDGALVEQPQEPDTLSLLSGAVAAAKEHRLRDIVRAAEAAATDDRVKAVVLDLDGFTGGGQAALQAVGEALDKVRAAKKPVLAYATGYTDDSYLLAAHATEIWLDPMGLALFTGPGGSRLYYKGLIDRLGVNAHVYRVGSFKSAIEPFTLTGQSPEARAANQALADALWEDWRASVAKARPKAKIAAVAADPAGTIEAARGNAANAALAGGLVDKLGDRLAFGARVAEIAGRDSDAAVGAFEEIKLASWIAANPAPQTGDAIGVVTVAGEIVDGIAPPGTAGGDTIAQLLLKGVAEKNLKALVVRVDSPGGSALASEKIRLAVLAARAKGLPVVVSMGNVAASGGYWVATAGSSVFAEPSTITGSIGVFGIIPTFETTLGKVGLSADGVRTTPLSGQPDLFGGTSPEFDRLVQASVEDIYRRFVGLVAQSRKLSPERVDEIGQGRVWAGGAARQLGLVDRFGGIDDAIAEAAKLAKLDPANVHAVYLEKQPDWTSGLLAAWFADDDEKERGEDAISRLSRQRFAALHAALANARGILEGPAMQVRCLECPAPPRAGQRVSLQQLVAQLLGWEAKR